MEFDSLDFKNDRGRERGDDRRLKMSMKYLTASVCELSIIQFPEYVVDVPRISPIPEEECVLHAARYAS